ncbi:MAG: ABC transporter ATP-binding protein [Candidatus Micrarchaeia archaeon]
MEVVKLLDITKTFGKAVALKDISLSVNQGSLLTLIGPNGAGKSTLEKIVVGLYEPDAGTVNLFGEKLSANSSKLMEKIGYVGENYALYDNLTVRSNLLFFASLFGIDKKEAEVRIAELLAEFGASQYIDRKVGELSRGTKQKVAICRALISMPKLLVLDEATAFLDPSSAEKLRQKIRVLLRKGTSVIYATQRLDELSRLTGYVALISEGKLISRGTFSEITRKIKGVDIEIVLLNEPDESQKSLLRKIGAKIYANRLVFRVNDLSLLPEISSKVFRMKLKILTINYINYDIGAAV